jgi:hypothetical protein
MRTLIACGLGSGGLLWFTVVAGCGSSGGPAMGGPDTGAPKDSEVDRSQPKDHAAPDTGSGGAGGCKNVGGVLPTECESCAKSKCDTELTACDCDPKCVKGVDCYNNCESDSGATLTCLNDCTPSAMVGFDAGAKTTADFLNCITTKCINVCTATAGDGGITEGGGG